jgi:glycosyltransferase involved in cell wall biosynthesis
MTRPWLLVAGDLTPLGGMDRANYALARFLAARGAEVHLVTHRAWPDLVSSKSVRLHRVWRPLDKHLLGSPLLSRAGRQVWRHLKGLGARGVVNGGNCVLPTTNWVHYVHAAYQPQVATAGVWRTKAGYAYRRDLDAERRALREAHLIICNSQRTKADVIERVGVEERRIGVVYYGTDITSFGYATAAERASARAAMGSGGDRPLVGFVGALGDRRKAFDTLFEAWIMLARRPRWDADLVVIGSGSELPAWRKRADAAGVAARMRFLGFRSDVAALLAGLDALVHPARYEAYGLSVHEAICRGVPAIVSRSAGVAELYPDGLSELLLNDPDDSRELAERLVRWRENLDRVRRTVAPFSASLAGRSWDRMAAEIAALTERAA